jgi:hypothetical protein
VLFALNFGSGSQLAIAENLRHCIQRCSCWISRDALHHRQKQQEPITTATCYVVSISQARERRGRGRILFRNVDLQNRGAVLSVCL